MSENITKQDIRKEIKSLRKTLSYEWIKKQSAILCQQLIQTEIFKSSKTVGLYLSSKSEVQTEELINYLHEKNIKMALPKKEETLDAYYWCSYNKGDTLQLGKHNIQEPCAKAPYSGTLDLILIPGLSFDLQGHRLGFGSGAYDRLLENNSAYKIGLGFSFQISGSIPAEKHDISMDMLATDEELHVINPLHNSLKSVI